MKKILLLAVFASTLSTVYAEGFSDYFRLTYGGETIAPGQTVTVGEYYDNFVKSNPEYAGLFPASYESKAEIFATNTTNAAQKLEVRLQYVSPTADEMAADSTLGNGSLCFSNQNGEENCLPSPFEFSSTMPSNPVAADQYMRLDVEQLNFTNTTVPFTLKLEMRVMDGATELASGYVNVLFSHESDTTLGVAGIESDAAAAYYTLQGLRVAEPKKGECYIELKGGKAYKRIF